MSTRGMWRTLPTAADRVDDRAVNGIAFSPLVVVAGWVVAQSFLGLTGTGSGADALVGPAIALWAVDAVLVAVDRLRMRGKRLWGLPSVLWGLAGPVVYLPLRRRALAANGVDDSWTPLVVHVACLALLGALVGVWTVLRAMTFGW